MHQGSGNKQERRVSSDKSLYRGPQALGPHHGAFETIAVLVKNAASTGMRVAVEDVAGAYLHANFKDLTPHASGLGALHSRPRLQAKMTGTVNDRCRQCGEPSTCFYSYGETSTI